MYARVVRSDTLIVRIVAAARVPHIGASRLPEAHAPVEGTLIVGAEDSAMADDVGSARPEAPRRMQAEGRGRGGWAYERRLIAVILTRRHRRTGVDIGVHEARRIERGSYA